MKVHGNGQPLPGRLLLLACCVLLAIRSAPLARAARPETARAVAGAAAADSQDRPYWRTNLFRRIVSDQPYLVKTWWPSELRRPTFAAPLAGALVAALQFGDPASQGPDVLLTHHASDALDSSRRASIFFTRIGNGLPLLTLLGTTYLGARHAGNDRLAASASLAGEALFDAALWSGALKQAFARVRPKSPGEGSFFRFGSSENGSFPSGHAMGAFAVASVFGELYRDKRWVRWTAYGGASLVAASRMTLHRHFPTDLLVGAMLGNSIGHMVADRSEQAGDRDRWWRRHMTPILAPDGHGAGIAIDFSRGPAETDHGSSLP